VRRPPTVRELVRLVSARLRPTERPRYIRIERSEALTLIRAWQQPDIPGKQSQQLDANLAAMRAGVIHPYHRVIAQALEPLDGPVSLLDVGCSQGYYVEVVRQLCPAVGWYVGLDYSAAMVTAAARRYQRERFIVGDAVALPLATDAWDVILLGGVILHLLDPERALHEAARVARQQVVVHRQPVLEHGRTDYFRKVAYGVPMMEVIFNQDDLQARLESAGLRPERSWMIERSELLGIDEPVLTMSYACRVQP
jgi:ubiquinone/menaquinone biosynthesis C-methylase UbiE